MTIIGLKELRTNTAEILRRVEAGESFTVVKHSKPVFTMQPLKSEQTSDGLDGWLKDYIDKNQALLTALADK